MKTIHIDSLPNMLPDVARLVHSGVYSLFEIDSTTVNGSVAIYALTTPKCKNCYPDPHGDYLLNESGSVVGGVLDLRESDIETLEILRLDGVSEDPFTLTWKTFVR